MTPRSRRPLAALALALVLHYLVLPLLLAGRADAADQALYLDSDGNVCDPKTTTATSLFLNSASPTATAPKCRDSGPMNFKKNNPWADIGTWTAKPAAGTLSALDTLHAWIGLRNSDDQGTQFDLRVEVYKGAVLVTSGLTRCITNVTRNPDLAKEVLVTLGSFSPVTFTGSETVSIKILARIGTTSTNDKCPGPGGSHASATGLRLYYDSANRASGLGSTLAGGNVPVFTSTPPTSAVTTLLYTYALAAQDPLGGSVTFELGQGPAGMTMPSPGILRWIPTRDQVGDNTVQVRARNSANATATQQFTIRTTQFNLNPQITSIPITFAKTGEDYRYQVAAFDPEEQRVTFAFGLTPPAGMTIDAGTGLIRWRPGAAAIGSHQVSVVASDPLGGSDTQTYRLNVLDAAASLTITSPVGAYSTTIGQTLTLPLQANLPNAVFGVNPVPANATLTPGSFSITPAATQEGTQTIAVSARVADLIASSIVTITVTRANRPPQIAPIAAQSVAEGGQLTFTVQATDPDGDLVTVSAPGLNLPGALFNTFTRQFTFAPGTGQAGNYQVTFVASDGRASSQTNVAIQVTGGQPQQQLLNLTVDPPSNPTLQSTVTISGSTTGNAGSVLPGATLPPLITGLSPASLRQGQSGVVEISGLNTQFAAATSRATFGDGITVTGLTVQSPTSARATIAIDKQAALGVRQVRVSSSTRDIPSVVGFSVTRGTASITGVVVDPVTGTPLANVRVFINGTTISAVTDAQGRFTIDDVPTGAQTLLVMLPNYEVVKLGLVVNANDTIALSDPIKINALARPPSVGGSLPRAATVASVLDRGVAAPSSSVTVEQAKAAISDTMIAVGGNEAGVLDEGGNQLNPNVSGPGLFSLTQKGVEAHARRLLLGVTYRLQDILFALRGAYSFALRFDNDAEIVFALQQVVNRAWANPDDPNAALILVMFSTGTTRPPDPPKISLETRLNSFQAFLFVSSFTSRFAPDIDHAITTLFKKKGLPAPRIGALPATTPATGGVTGGLRHIQTMLAGLIGPGVAHADPVSNYLCSGNLFAKPDETVAERRLREKCSWTAGFRTLHFADVIPDLIIGGVAGAALAWGMATTANLMLASSGTGGATVAIGRQVLIAAAVGAAFAVFQKLAQIYTLNQSIQFLHPDPPIGQGAVLLSDGTAVLTFEKSAADIRTATLQGHSLYPNDPSGSGNGVFIHIEDYTGLDQTKFSYEYRLYKVRTVDDENVAKVPPLPIRPHFVTDVNGKVIPNKLKFVVPKDFLDKDKPNFFRMATFQIYDLSAQAPTGASQPYHYTDVGATPPGFWDDHPWLSKLFSFSSAFAAPGAFGIPGPNYLAPLFLDASIRAAQAIVNAKNADYLAGMQDYLQRIFKKPQDDYLAAKGRVKVLRDTIAKLSQDQQAVLQAHQTAAQALERHASVLDLIKNNPTVSLTEPNPVTAQIAQLFGVSQLSQADASKLQRLSNADQAAGTVDTLKTSQDLYRSRVLQLEAQLADIKAQAQAAGRPVTLDDLAGVKVQGRPSFAIQNDVLVGEPSLGPNVTVEVLSGFSNTTEIGDVQVTIRPGVGVPLSLDELKSLDADQTAKLNNAQSKALTELQAASDDVRALTGALDVELDPLTQQLKDLEIKQNTVAQELRSAEFALDNAHENLMNDVRQLNAAESVIQADAIAAADSAERNLRAFQFRANALGQVLSALGVVYLWVDTNRSLRLGAAILPSELSETQVVDRPNESATLTARIARDPLVPYGLLTVGHEDYDKARSEHPNDRFPVKDGSLSSVAYNDQALEITPTNIVPSMGFPSDFFAVDDGGPEGKGSSVGVIYANNANSNANFAGRNFRFTRPVPLPQDGTGVVRDFAGSLYYYSLDAFRPPPPAEPIAMAVGDFCCDVSTGDVINTPFVADVDFSRDPPIGRVVRLPIEQRGLVPDTRLFGRPWVLDPDLKLETASTLVPGHVSYLPGLSPPRRPLLLSDGPRIWFIYNSGFGEPNIEASHKQIVSTFGRQWAGLLVDRTGNLLALDSLSGEIWMLPKERVLPAVLDTLIGDQFDAAAFKIATGHVGGLDLAGTYDDNGYFVADKGGAVVRERLPVVGVLPSDLTIESLDLVDGLNHRFPVVRYEAGGKRRFLAQIDPADARRLHVKLVAKVAGVASLRVAEITLPLLAPFVWPEDDLARKLKGQQ